MIALKVWSKLCILGRYSVFAGSIHKSKLNDLVFYNTKHVKLHVACSAEQNVTQDGCCLHHCVACAFKQDCIVHTSKKHFENKM